MTRHLQPKHGEEEEKISTEQSTGSLSWMYGAAFSPESSHGAHGG